MPISVLTDQMGKHGFNWNIYTRKSYTKEIDGHSLIVSAALHSYFVGIAEDVVVLALLIACK